MLLGTFSYPSPSYCQVLRPPRSTIRLLSSHLWAIGVMRPWRLRHPDTVMAEPNACVSARSRQPLLPHRRHWISSLPFGTMDSPFHLPRRRKRTFLGHYAHPYIIFMCKDTVGVLVLVHSSGLPDVPPCFPYSILSLTVFSPTSSPNRFALPCLRVSILDSICFYAVIILRKVFIDL
ncbi:hypothetical protein GSI_12972 [Ganoderma sinense ZZ0214-1]|uniref:Uncharacterized protein n=1 Tax=Ganoderma sinense ZZ0214-1 TaxID=1077348 RepID=A0A2G8RUA0_9APHY|nr:hypothetical protein GSI_12972 [Ganoderma sinense ZZ0214-1]